MRTRRTKLNLKTLRVKKGFSQLDLSKHLNIGISTYNQYENGSRKIPADTAKKIADLLGTNTDDIFIASRFTIRE